MVESIEMDGERGPNFGSFNERNSDPRFINRYNGIFREKLEFDHNGVDRFLRLTAVNKTVTLSEGLASFPGKKGNDRLRKIEFSREGYRIEFVDFSILQGLRVQVGPDPTDQNIAEEYNRLFKSSVLAVAAMENIKGAGDFRSRLAATLIPPGIMMGINFSDGIQGEDALPVVITSFLGYGLLNMLGKSDYNFPLSRRSLSSFYEYVMPAIEMDRWIAGWAFLKGPGRDLVRLTPNQGSR